MGWVGRRFPVAESPGARDLALATGVARVTALHGDAAAF